LTGEKTGSVKTTNGEAGKSQGKQPDKQGKKRKLSPSPAKQTKKKKKDKGK
jgi:hypothetical protein